MHSDCDKPLNLGSDEMITMNDFLAMAVGFSGKSVTYKHIPGPEGVRGRNSDNTLIKKVLGWSPQIELKDGLRRTYEWIKKECEKVKNSKDGANVDLQKSTIVKQNEDELNDFNFEI